MHRLLAVLAESLGAQQASLEFKWMQQAVASTEAPVPLGEMVRRRSLGEPLQYILGTQPFGPLTLLTRPPVLIPRPETEHWVIRLSKTLSPTPRRPMKLLDLGTGSACIPLLLCHLWPAGSLTAHAVDISPHALRLAKDNASLCGVPPSSDTSNPQNTLTMTCADFLSPDFPSGPGLENSLPIDILTSNPPYISWEEYQQLPDSVVKYEDPKALFGGPSGLDFYHAVVRLLCHGDLFNRNAFVALEVGHRQAESVEALIRSTGRITESEIWADSWGKKRTVVPSISFTLHYILITQTIRDSIANHHIHITAPEEQRVPYALKKTLVLPPELWAYFFLYCLPEPPPADGAPPWYNRDRYISASWCISQWAPLVPHQAAVALPLRITPPRALLAPGERVEPERARRRRILGFFQGHAHCSMEIDFHLAGLRLVSNTLPGMTAPFIRRFRLRTSFRVYGKEERCIFGVFQDVLRLMDLHVSRVPGLDSLGNSTVDVPWHLSTTCLRSDLLSKGLGIRECTLKIDALFDHFSTNHWSKPFISAPSRTTPYRACARAPVLL